MFTTGDVVIIESLPPPPPVCRRVRARRGRKAPGRACCGSCAAKQEKVVGWRVHLVRRLQHALTRVQMLPAGMHDLTPPRMGGRMACPPGRGGWATVTANNYSPLRSRRRRRASRRRRGRRSSCDRGRPCVRTPGGWTPSTCARIVAACGGTAPVNRRRRAPAVKRPAPMPGVT